MIRTRILPCQMPHKLADALNQESGRLYTRALVEHYRIYRQTGHWLSPHSLEKLVDFYDMQEGRAKLLHAHSIDAAEQGFPKACKTARECRRLGLDAHYPCRRKAWRTTIWKNTGIRRKDVERVLLLALARGREPIRVSLPESFPIGSVDEVRLVYDRVGRRYEWHLVMEDGRSSPPPPGERTAAVDLGEIHPAAATDGEESVIFSARILRSTRQFTAKRLAKLQAFASRLVKGSRRWKRLKRRRTLFLAQQRRRTRDIEHKVSRAVVDWAVEHKIRTLGLGDVRDVADGKRLNSQSQQKISNWSHGKVRRYLTYKAEGEGITVKFIEEHFSSQTCPVCGQRTKPAGRIYRCSGCGFRGHRDGQVGTVNLLSRLVTGEVGNLDPPETLKYRYPALRRATSCRTSAIPGVRRAGGRGKRSRPDTGQRETAVAWEVMHV